MSDERDDHFKPIGDDEEDSVPGFIEEISGKVPKSPPRRPSDSSGGFCTTCGKKRRDGDAFCGGCGAAFARDVQIEKPAPSPKQAFCLGCGRQLLQGESPCPSCGLQAGDTPPAAAKPPAFGISSTVVLVTIFSSLFTTLFLAVLGPAGVVIGVVAGFTAIAVLYKGPASFRPAGIVVLCSALVGTGLTMQKLQRERKETAAARDAKDATLRREQQQAAALRKKHEAEEEKRRAALANLSEEIAALPPSTARDQVLPLCDKAKSWRRLSEPALEICIAALNRKAALIGRKNPVAGLALLERGIELTASPEKFRKGRFELMTRTAPREIRRGVSKSRDLLKKRHVVDAHEEAKRTLQLARRYASVAGADKAAKILLEKAETNAEAIGDAKRKQLPRGHTSSTTQGGTTCVPHDKTETWVLVKSHVENQLKNPSSADFPWFDMSMVTRLSGGEYSIRAYVDATNSFGGEVRSQFSYEICWQPDGRARIVRADIW